MKARILKKSEEKLWEQFVKNHLLATIHQSPKWGAFQKEIPERGKYYIVVLEDDTSGKIIGGTMIIRHQLPKGFSWFYAARGPLLDYTAKNLQEQIDALIEILKPIAKEEKAIFLRIDPPLVRTTGETRKGENKSVQLKQFKISHSGFQPEHTLILDLTKSQEDLLKEMKPKGRYNIRLAKRKGVKIHKADPSKKDSFQKDISNFYKILLETTSRDKFHGHKKDFYETMLHTLGKDLSTLYLAKYEGKVIAGTIVTTFKETATYYYGASSNEYRNVMAPYLLQWQAAIDAKNKGQVHYDFLGISPPSEKNHPWTGVTDFKKKFGGNAISYQPPQEFAFKKTLYFLYRIYKKLRH